MAILTEGRLLITDASNVPLSGGKARIYNTGTTTLTSVFSDAGLSVPLTNPVVANSAGFTPVIFAAEGTSVDVTYLTSADATVSSRTYTAVPFLGADTGTFTRTLAGNTRFKISDSGGVVLMQVGDASPDNSGGQLTIEGWAGTQGDTLTLDFAAINTTGKLTENSKKLDGVVYTARTSFSGATVDITLPNDPTGCLAWEVDFWDVITSGSSQLQMRLAYGGGAIKSGASDYAHTSMNDDGAGASPVSHRDAADPYIVAGFATAGSATKPLSGTVRVLTHATANTTVRGLLYGDGGSYPQAVQFTGFGLNGYGVASTLQLLLNAGSFTSGYYRVRPLRGYGET